MLRYILFFKILLFSDCKKCHSSWKDLCGRLGGGAIVYSWECDILGRARGSLCVQPLLHHTLHLWVTFDATRCTLALTTPAQCILTIKYYSQPGHRVHFCVNFIAPPVTTGMLCALYLFQLTSTQMEKFLWFYFESQIMQIAKHEIEVLLSKSLNICHFHCAKNLSNYGHTNTSAVDVLLKYCKPAWVFAGKDG